MAQKYYKNCSKRHKIFSIIILLLFFFFLLRKGSENYELYSNRRVAFVYTGDGDPASRVSQNDARTRYR